MISALISLSLIALGGGPGFSLEDTGHSLLLTEAGKPVFVYHYTLVQPPDGVDAHYQRLAYIHPLFGPNGEILTSDFPDDHLHHRGVFWAWPECTVGDRKIDVWAMADARQIHEKFLKKEAGPDQAEIMVQNAWVWDDAPDQPQVRETIGITAHPAEAGMRAIDFDMHFQNVSGKDVTFLGATDKGYGGLCFRPDKDRKPMHFTTASGAISEDQLRYDTPWADVSFEATPDANEETTGDVPQVGVAVLQHPSNPGYPHPGWIFRHYSFLGVCWPHEQTHVLKPGESFQLRYRMLVHGGSAAQAQVKEAFEGYLQESR